MPHDDERPRSRCHEGRTGSDGPARTSAPRERRPGPKWVWLAVGVVGLMAGIVVGHGLLIAAGLVVAGMAGQLLDPQRSRHRNRVPRPR
ncbi:hypothetical protein [Streptomyces sp. NBC_01185]|uniref:hypothetical protein n=1 Tax=Streptomyces sp. NBC_01185 TaxID=2903764 RepID=UPI00386AFA66|nr:hypothetical protein OG770_04255 [Streptomyces sp. NBC_01185]